jgi:predicted Zn-dependent protease
MKRLVVWLVSTSFLLACQTSPLGRNQLILVSDAQLEQMGGTAYQQIKQETPVSKNGRVNAYVSCVALAVTSALDANAADHWQVTVFHDDQANAFALPGGRIGVYDGLLKVANNQDQLATVIGHEVAHIKAHHPAERISEQFAAETGLQLAQLASGAPSPAKDQLFGLLGLGAQVGILLPFSRAQESEADLVGLDLMARAGFDPRESVVLWNNMAKSGKSQPPEFLSTHPSGSRRIQDLQARMPLALGIAQTAQAQRRAPNCHT